LQWTLKFGNLQGEWCSNEPLGTQGVGLWKNIRRGWEKFSTHTRFEVGDGSKVSFLHELWCGDMALKEGFLDLYGIARPKDAFVAAHLEILGGSNQWFVSFARAAHD
jgi:hypothetical protein